MYKAEYIWLDSKKNFRSKIKIINSVENISLETFPIWNFDGSSTDQQIHSNNSEVFLEPYYFYKYDDNYLVFCDCFVYVENDKKYLSFRRECYDLLEKNKDYLPQFGFEQEFFMLDPKTNLPFGLSNTNQIINTVSETGEYKNSYYCGIGAGNVCNNNREFMSSVLDDLIKLNVGVTGMNMEVSPSQGEIQICNFGIKACDELILLRYLLVKKGEKFNIKISFKPKLSNIPKTYNGSGCHVNFSTVIMRSDYGYNYIIDFIKKLGKNKDYLSYYGGEDNKMRLTGKNETCKWDEFKYGIGDRKASIRIPNIVFEEKKGYFEDRRPSADCDPYLVSLFLIKNI